MDPKNFDEGSFVDFHGEVCIIPPNSFALARTIEYFKIPRNILTVCLGKSTYARCGIIVNVTPFEPEWEGFVTLEFSNTTPYLQKYMQMKEWPKLFFLSRIRTMYAKCLTKIVEENIRGRMGLLAKKFNNDRKNIPYNFTSLSIFLI